MNTTKKEIDTDETDDESKPTTETRERSSTEPDEVAARKPGSPTDETG